MSFSFRCSNQSSFPSHPIVSLPPSPQCQTAATVSLQVLSDFFADSTAIAGNKRHSHREIFTHPWKSRHNNNSSNTTNNTNNNIQPSRLPKYHHQDRPAPPRGYLRRTSSFDHHHHHSAMPFLPRKVEVHQHAAPPLQKMTVFDKFNLHAQGCSRCRKPLEVALRGEQLCDEGHHLASEVAKSLYKLAGEKAMRYGTDHNTVSLLVDFTDHASPVYELCQAIEHNRNHMYASRETPLYTVRPRSVYHDHSPPSPSYYQNPSPSAATPRGHYHSSSPSSSVRGQSRQDETPRRSGHIRVNVPIAEYGHESSYYETFTHANGGRVTTKYYHTEPHPHPQLSRANTVTEPGVSKPTRRTTVHFNPEVKYFAP